MSNAVVAKRQYNVDLLRITASFFVVLVHVASAYWGWGDMYRPGWTGIAAYAVSTRCCVPLFVMLSGKLFLDRKSCVPIRKLYFNYALKLVVLYVVWGLMYAVDALGLKAVLSGAWVDIPKQFATAPHYHLWYLPMQTLIYLMIPMFWAVAKHEDGKHLGYICAILCAYSVVNATLKMFVPVNETVEAFLGKYDADCDIYWTYFLLGYYLTTKKWDKLKVWHCLLGFFVSVAVATIYTACASRMSGEYNHDLLQSHPITTFGATVFLFLAFMKMPCNLSERTGKLVGIVSRCTLFVYLFHPVVITRLEWVGINAVTFNTWIWAPVAAVIVFAICMIPALVLTKIPVVNKWLL